MPEIFDDKSEHFIPFILERLEAHGRNHAGEEIPPPFFLGLNGVQGSGKTTLVGNSFFYISLTVQFVCFVLSTVFKTLHLTMCTPA